MNFVWKTDEGEAESIVLLIFGGALIVEGLGVVGLGREFHLETAEMTSFSSRDVSR